MRTKHASRERLKEMRKIIKSKVYDTNTAKKMGTFRDLEGSSGFDHYEVSLYRKKTGEFFLHTCSSPKSQYHEITGYSDGARIIPLTYDEAQKWAETALTKEQYKNIFFGAIDEGTEMEALTVQLPAAIVIQLRRQTDKSGQLIKEAVAEALRQWLKMQEE
jgi:hypothetical protein